MALSDDYGVDLWYQELSASGFKILCDSWNNHCSDYATLYQLALFYTYNEELDSAILFFTQALDVRDTAWEAFNNRGACNAMLGNYSAAIPDLKSFVGYNNADLRADAARVMAICYDSLSLPDSAERWYRTAYELSPSVYIISFLVGYSLRHVSSLLSGLLDQTWALMAEEGYDALMDNLNQLASPFAISGLGSRIPSLFEEGSRRLKGDYARGVALGFAAFSEKDEGRSSSYAKQALAYL